MQKSLVMNLNFHNPVADQVLQAALEKAQKDPIVRSEILTISAGYLLRNAQKRQCAVDAVPLLKEAHNILPDRPTSLRLLGEAHLFLWKNVAAIVALGAALKIKPDAWAHYLSLVLLRSMADPERLADLEHPKQILPVAKQHVQPAIELNHAQPSNHNGPGTVLANRTAMKTQPRSRAPSISIPRSKESTEAALRAPGIRTGSGTRHTSYGSQQPSRRKH